MFTEDHDAFFEIDGHAVNATYQPTTGPAVTVKGIYNNEYFDEVDGMVAVEGSQPTFTCESADVSGVAHDEGLTVNGIHHNIKNVQPDGTGQTTLVLEIFEPNGNVYQLDFSESYNSQYLVLI